MGTKSSVLSSLFVASILLAVANARDESRISHDAAEFMAW
jgi:hypothetical protein